MKSKKTITLTTIKCHEMKDGKSVETFISVGGSPVSEEGAKKLAIENNLFYDSLEYTQITFSEFMRNFMINCIYNLS